MADLAGGGPPQPPAPSPRPPRARGLGEWKRLWSWRKSGLRPGRAAGGVRRGGAAGRAAGTPAGRAVAAALARRRSRWAAGGGGCGRVTARGERVRRELVRLSKQITRERNGEGRVAVGMAKVGTLYLLPWILALIMMPSRGILLLGVRGI